MIAEIGLFDIANVKLRSCEQAIFPSGDFTEPCSSGPSFLQSAFTSLKLGFVPNVDDVHHMNVTVALLGTTDSRLCGSRVCVLSRALQLNLRGCDAHVPLKWLLDVFGRRRGLRCGSGDSQSLSPEKEGRGRTHPSIPSSVAAAAHTVVTLP